MFKTCSIDMMQTGWDQRVCCILFLDICIHISVNCSPDKLLCIVTIFYIWSIINISIIIVLINLMNIYYIFFTSKFVCMFDTCVVKKWHLRYSSSDTYVSLRCYYSIATLHNLHTISMRNVVRITPLLVLSDNYYIWYIYYFNYNISIPYYAFVIVPIFISTYSPL